MDRQVAARRQRPDRLKRLADGYQVGDLIVDDEGRVPVRWWAKTDNFGDLLSPWLIGKMTGREVVYADPEKPHYAAVGSILYQVNEHSRVWGSGAFGTEDGDMFSAQAHYSAVRGPLSRARLIALQVPCPEVYGDPALLAPAYFAPKVETTHEYGVMVRWSERRWDHAEVGPGVKVIDLGTADVEGVIRDMLSCRRILTGSLHGLIMADAYGIPSAYVRSYTALGGEYKFFDYFSTVDKFRNPRHFRTQEPVTVARLRDSLDFDPRPIVFDYRKLLEACPFLEHVGAGVSTPPADEQVSRAAR